MRVLAAILANAWQVALDVAGIKRRLIKRWSEQQHQTSVVQDQAVPNGFYCRSNPLRLSLRHDCPGLRNRVDLAFLIAGGTQRFAIVEEGAAIPAAVPGFALQSRF